MQYLFVVAVEQCWNFVAVAPTTFHGFDHSFGDALPFQLSSKKVLPFLMQNHPCFSVGEKLKSLILIFAFFLGLHHLYLTVYSDYWDLNSSACRSSLFTSFSFVSFNSLCKISLSLNCSIASAIPCSISESSSGAIPDAFSSDAFFFSNIFFEEG